MPMAVLEVGVYYAHIPRGAKGQPKRDFIKCHWYDDHFAHNEFTFHYLMLENLK